MQDPVGGLGSLPGLLPSLDPGQPPTRQKDQLKVSGLLDRKVEEALGLTAIKAAIGDMKIARKKESAR